jgi:triacylglycerol lipase
MSSTLQSVPMYLAPSFDLTAATTCAAMVNAAYDQYNQFKAQSTPFPPSPSSFNWTWTGPNNIVNPLPIWWIQHLFVSEPIGFLATDGAGNAYLVFRGTMSTQDKAMDARFSQTAYGLVSNFGNVYTGYYEIYTNLSLPTAPSGQTTLLSAIGALSGVTNFYFTGHSLGAGLSSLAVPDVSTNGGVTASMVHYNYGSPRVGDVTFAQAMNFATTIPTFRVVNTEDLVPIAPTPVSATGPMVYQHIGTPVDFTANYGSAVTNHSMANTYTYALANTSNPYNNNQPSSSSVIDGDGALSRLVTVTANPAAVAAS